MGMKKFILAIITVFALFAVLVLAADTNIFTNYNFNLNNIYNVTNITASGNITALNFYGNVVLKSINLTTTTYNGSFVNGSLVGYQAANNICNITFSNSHFCTQFEVILNINLAKNVGNDDGWVSTGSPKYIPATIPVDDCYGFRYDLTATHLGNYWKYNSTEGGYGAAINCGSLIKISCCVVS